MAEQPKNFGFGEDETMLRDSARKFFADNSTADKLHRLVAHDFRIDQRNGTSGPQLAAATDGRTRHWTAACVPEPPAVLAHASRRICSAEEISRSACPSPLITTMAATVVLNACIFKQPAGTLAGIAEG